MCVSGGMDLDLSSAVWFSLNDRGTPLCVTYPKSMIAMRWQFFLFLCGVRVVLYWDVLHRLGMDLYRQFFIFYFSFVFYIGFCMGYCAPIFRLNLTLSSVYNYCTAHMLFCTFFNLDYYE